jgi:hypothetical protein
MLNRIVNAVQYGPITLGARATVMMINISGENMYGPPVSRGSWLTYPNETKNPAAAVNFHRLSLFHLRVYIQ